MVLAEAPHFRLRFCERAKHCICDWLPRDGVEI
jgi:hypothetical protein